MKVHFQTKIAGFRVDELIEAESPDAVVTELRNQVARDIPHIPLTKKDDKYREELDVDGKGDWTNQEFFEAVVGYYNAEMRPKNQQPVPVPVTCKAFIDLAVLLGMAKVIDHATGTSGTSGAS